VVERKQKLDLTWIGKENRPKLEPRILLEDPEKSYHAKHRVTSKDIFDNRLIYGDNLLALKALEQEFAGKVKCVFIDPPYNTGSAFEHYDDGLEHSLWLSLMRDRLEILGRLLSDYGSIWITIDDNEAHYLKVLCDEMFGRGNFVATVIWEKRTSRWVRGLVRYTGKTIGNIPWKPFGRPSSTPLCIGITPSKEATSKWPSLTICWKLQALALCRTTCRLMRLEQVGRKSGTELWRPYSRH
jgi:hypothetical protein